MLLYHSRPAEVVPVAFVHMMRMANVEEMEAAGVATTQPDELVVHTALLKEAEAVVGAIDRTVVVEAVEWVLPLS
jgi:hypothetical protein